MGVSQLQGTPWHIEIMHGEKGEKKRSKLRCAHYDPLTKKCRVKQECGGTMYCTQYSALGKNTYKKRKETVEEIKKLHAVLDRLWINPCPICAEPYQREYSA